MTDSYLHTLSPFIVQFSNGMGVRWYGASYMMGFVVGWFLLRWMSLRGVTPLSVNRITDAMLILGIGVVLGGRLGYVIFYDPALIWTFTGSMPWWGVLQLNNGGMSSHGGMIGVLTASWWIARSSARAGEAKVPMLHVMDLTAVACTPGLFFGRLANFINGELLGKIVAAPGEQGPWWSVRFPQERFSGHEPALNPAQEQGLYKLIDSFRVGGESDVMAYDRVLHVLQSGKGQSAEVAAKLGPLLAARHPSQLYQALAEGVVVGGILLLVWIMPRKPGVIVGLFLMCYGVLRVLTELYRLPDAGFAVQRIVGLSRGQWLSVAMIGFGLLCVYLASRRVEVFGGWYKRAASPQSGATS